MKKSKRILTFLLAMLLTFIFPFTALASDYDDHDLNRMTAAGYEESDEDSALEQQIIDLEAQIETLEAQLETAESNHDDVLAAELEAELENLKNQIEALEDEADDEEYDEELDEEDLNDDESDEDSALEQQLDGLDEQKDLIEEKIEKIQEQIEELEEQYEAAAEAEDAALMASLEAQIDLLKQELSDLKADFQDLVEQMKALEEQRYSQEELNEISKVTEKLGRDPQIRVLPVSNIFLKNGSVKFDVPPVIKSGRILLPLRAIAESTGAQVQWDAENQTVTIIKEGITIVLRLGENTVLVNNVEATTDVPCEIMNNRTVVPLRFISENLGHKVQWHEETETVEIG
jgi:predicted RNase H-like nuclease (RuvC/YqgF family)